MISHSEKMRVEFSDTDASGLIHYTSALRYFEVPEHQLMRKLFKDDSPGERDFGLPRVHVECDYKAGLRHGDEFECTVRIEKVGRSSVTYGYEARRPDGELCLVGRIIAVCIGPDGKTMPFPDATRATLESAL